VLDIYLVGGAALLVAAWLRIQFYVLFRDGLFIAGLVFIAYLAVAAYVQH
jgi:hypothetical protein